MYNGDHHGRRFLSGLQQIAVADNPLVTGFVTGFADLDYVRLGLVVSSLPSSGTTRVQTDSFCHRTPRILQPIACLQRAIECLMERTSCRSRCLS